MTSIFFRLLGTANKHHETKACVEAVLHSTPANDQVYLVNPATLERIPGAPFSYWASDSTRINFEAMPPLESGSRTAKQGLATADDFRFVRLWWEVQQEQIYSIWFPFAKGGAYAPYYADHQLVVNWQDFGREIRNLFTPGSTRIASRPQNIDFYFKPGVTWSDRTTSLFSARVWPRGGVFSVKGSAGFFPGEEFFAIGLLNSLAFNLYLSLLVGAGDAAARSYQVGTIGSVPWPSQDDSIADWARQAWELKRDADTATEHSHVFTTPILLRCQGRLSERVDQARREIARCTSKLRELDRNINAYALSLYGLTDSDVSHLPRVAAASHAAESEPENENDPNETPTPGPETEDLVRQLISWAIGVAIGRFRLDFAFVELDHSMDPFEKLPVASPGMAPLSNSKTQIHGAFGEHLPSPPPLLVDDESSVCDLVPLIQSVFDHSFEEDHQDLWDDAWKVISGSSTGGRHWLAREFFDYHSKLYSRSRRRAPIYWQLATPSASYSVWLYYHRLTRDTFYQVLNDFVVPKVRHEEAKLTELRQDSGPSPTGRQRQEIEAQETFVEELRAYREEVERVAPLWNPNLNDGVILNFAPLWRLVPQHREWQKECRECWNKLAAGDYDWAHLAMHLWPERVVPKCATDRSLAIAHDLEEVFWQEGPDGKWRQKSVPPETIAALVAERTSPAVRDARDQLLQAPEPLGRRGARRAASTPRPPRAPRAPRPAAPEPQTAPTPRPRATADPQAREAILRHLSTTPAGASKSDLLAATALDESAWKPTIDDLLATGQVTRTGEKRGTRYHLAAPTRVS